MYNLTRNKEHLYSSMRFQGDGRTVRVPLTFDLREGDGLAVDFGRGLVNNYKLDDSVTPKVLVFDEPLPKGETITIRRLTYIEKVPHIFQWLGNAQGGADFSAVNIDENFEQITRASQDAMDAQVLSALNLEEMAGIRDDALDARDRAILAETNAKRSEGNSKDSETIASQKADAASRDAASAKSSLEAVRPLHADVVRLAPEVSANAASADVSAKAAKASEDNAKVSETTAANMAAAASSSATRSANSANQAGSASANANAAANRASISEGNAKGSEELAKKWATNPVDIPVDNGEYSAYHWAKVAKEAVDFDPTLYRKKDDLVFQGVIQGQASGTGTGIAFINAVGGDMAKIVPTATGLQFTQHLFNGTEQTFTFPNTGGEITTATQLNTKQDKLSFKGTGNVVRESVTDTLESSVYQAQLSANTALQTAQSKQDKLEFIGSGKAMKEGAYGVGYLQEWSKGERIEDYFKRIRVTGLAYADNTSDDPSDGAGLGASRVIHIGSSGHWEAQFLTPAYQSRIFLRTRGSSGGPFNKWEEIYSTYNTRTDKNGVLHATTGAVNTTATEEWVKSQGYITAADVPKGFALGPVQKTGARLGQHADTPENCVIVKVGVLKVGSDGIGLTGVVRYRKIISL